VANTRRFIEGAGLANIIVSETSFEEAAARGGDNNLDVIALHGIFSWVARPIQDAIIAIVPKRILELGSGQGFGLSLLAAANPHIAFEGYDFNPEHQHGFRRASGRDLGFR
jgi:hypothetical protein